MNRFYGIGVAVAGVAVMILSVLKIAPLTSTGVFLILLGLFDCSG